jgi:hypothetical protein
MMLKAPLDKHCHHSESLNPIYKYNPLDNINTVLNLTLGCLLNIC